MVKDFFFWKFNLASAGTVGGQINYVYKISERKYIQSSNVSKRNYTQSSNAPVCISIIHRITLQSSVSTL